MRKSISCLSKVSMIINPVEMKKIKDILPTSFDGPQQIKNLINQKLKNSQRFESFELRTCQKSLVDLGAVMVVVSFFKYSVFRKIKRKRETNADTPFGEMTKSL